MLLSCCLVHFSHFITKLKIHHLYLLVTFSMVFSIMKISNPMINFKQPHVSFGAVLMIRMHLIAQRDRIAVPTQPALMYDVLEGLS